MTIKDTIKAMRESIQTKKEANDVLSQMNELSQSLFKKDYMDLSTKEKEEVESKTSGLKKEATKNAYSDAEYEKIIKWLKVNKKGTDDEIDNLSGDSDALINYAKDNGYKESNKEAMIIKRVAYGKDDTPEQDREYNLNGAGPVGTVSEWIAYAQSQGEKTLTVIEKDGTKRTVKTESIKKEEVTPDKFKKFVAVQKSGKYNMFDPRARSASGLSEVDYRDIMRNYDDYAKQFKMEESIKSKISSLNESIHKENDWRIEKDILDFIKDEYPTMGKAKDEYKKNPELFLKKAADYTGRSEDSINQNIDAFVESIHKEGYYKDKKNILSKYKSKILQFPDDINIEGHVFELGGQSSAAGMASYVKGDKAWTTYNCYDDNAENDLGFRTIYVNFKWQNNSLKPDDVSIER